MFPQNRYQQRIQELKGKIVDVGLGSQFIHLGEEVLQQVEKLIGFALPSCYREFLRDFGGVSFLHGLTYPTPYADGVGSIELFFGVAPEDCSQGLVSEYFQWRDSFIGWPIELVPGIRLVRDINKDTSEVSWPAELLPIAMDAGSNQICLALAGLRPGAIFFWANAPGEGDENVFVIADSFDDFMQSLYLRSAPQN